MMKGKEYQVEIAVGTGNVGGVKHTKLTKDILDNKIR